MTKTRKTAVRKKTAPKKKTVAKKSTAKKRAPKSKTFHVVDSKGRKTNLKLVSTK